MFVIIIKNKELVIFPALKLILQQNFFKLREEDAKGKDKNILKSATSLPLGLVPTKVHRRKNRQA